MQRGHCPRWRSPDDPQPNGWAPCPLCGEAGVRRFSQRNTAGLAANGRPEARPRPASQESPEANMKAGSGNLIQAGSFFKGPVAAAARLAPEFFDLWFRCAREAAQAHLAALHPDPRPLGRVSAFPSVPASRSAGTVPAQGPVRGDGGRFCGAGTRAWSGVCRARERLHKGFRTGCWGLPAVPWAARSVGIPCSASGFCVVGLRRTGWCGGLWSWSETA